MTAPTSPDQLAQLEALIDATLVAACDEIEAIAAVERVPGPRPFWYVRIDGDTKTHFSAEFTLDQRTLTVESYFMPDPDENRAQVFEHLLVRNSSMHAVSFIIGSGPASAGAPAVYLRGIVENRSVDAPTVDRMLAAIYDYTEQFFVPAMRLGFESRFDR